MSTDSSAAATVDKDKAAPTDTDAEFVTLEEIDAEIERRRKALKSAEDERKRVDQLLKDPVEQARRRHLLRTAIADWIESSPLSDDQMQSIAQYLPPDQKWIIEPPALKAGGWEVISMQQRDGKKVDRWRLNPEQAPDLARATEARNPGVVAGTDAR